MKLIKNNLDLNEDLLKDLSSTFNLDKNLIQFLYSRGYTTKESIQTFLHPSFNQFYDPFLFNDMKKVVDKINLAVKENKRILIFGDYDTDGIGSSAILIKYFREIGVEVNYYLPSRYNDGYGLTIDAIKKINELYKPELIITVDCGISCKKEIEFANSLGIDVIVTDHHDIPEELPNCLIIDAKMENEKYPFKSLCGAGVALKLVEALSSLEECKKYFTIASISTIADIVSLTDENRFIVTYGLQNFDKFCPKGVKLLIKKLKIYTPNSSDISSKLAPKLNAAGRMGDASIALDLYINDNEKLLNQRVNDIITMNTKRKDLCDDVYFDVSKMISKMDIDSMHSIIMYNKNWGIGILGIVAAKITDEYKKPTFLFGYDERTGNLTGSGRSIDGVDLHEGLTSLSDLLVSFGGHYIAAGLSLKEDNLSKFISKFEEFASEKMSKIEDPKLSYDFELSANDINIQFMNQLNLLEPFGMGNEKPLILVKSFNSSCEFNKNFPQYLNINIDKIKVIAFNFKDYYYEINSKCQKDFILDLSLEKYGKSTQIHGILKNIYVEKLGNMNSSTLKFEYLKQIKSINGDSNDYSSYNNINDVLSNINTYFGSLIVCYSYKEYFDLTKNYDLSKFTYFKYFSLNNKFNYNSIIIAPKNLSQYMGYQNIIFLDPLIDSGYIREIRSINKDCHIYLPNNKKFDIGFIGIISLDHNIFKTYYTLFKQNIFAEDELQYYKKINSINKNVNIIQYCFCLMVFEELKIINLVFEERFSIKINKNIKVELKQSKIYNKVALLKKIM